jgi:anthranilate synthase component II
MKILLLDNYDSFTYNLVHLLEQFEEVKLTVSRNDKIALNEIKQFDRIVLSPGPGLPVDAGIMMDLIKEYAASKPILGVCLGHQAIAESFGARLFNMNNVMHGVWTKTIVTGKNEKLFRSLPEEFLTGRYHSWMVEKKTLPACFSIIAEDEERQIMAIAHNDYPLKGLQFHPESVMTPVGKKIVENWLKD